MRMLYRKLLNACFKAICYLASFSSMLFLIVFLIMITLKSVNGLYITKIHLEMPAPALQKNKLESIKLINQSIRQYLSESTNSTVSEDVYTQVISIKAPYTIYNHIKENKILPGDRVELWVNGSAATFKYFNSLSPLDHNAELLVKKLVKHQMIDNFINWDFFLSSDSSEAEAAGIGSSLIGSLMMVSICIAIAFPLGLITAIYLEEFAPRNFFTKLIELNINNLSAVPSIVFGLLGMTLFIFVANLPRSSAIVGGLTLAILIMPIIVTTARQALSTVPQNIKDAAMGLGASNLQIVFHHCLPIAMPSIVTGTILAISRALGETAPLIIIGMAAFITTTPHNIFEPTTALPVQIFLWSDNPDLMFVEKASLAIFILLLVLSIINFLAHLVRKKYYINNLSK